MAFGENEVPIPEEIQVKLKQLGNLLHHEMPKGWGFALLIFQFGEKGTLTYISNAQREGIVDCMKEFVEKFGS